MLIAIAGPHNSGKDVCAKVLQKEFGFQRLAWADAVAKVVSYKYNLPYQKLLGLNDSDRQWRLTPHPNLCYEQNGVPIYHTPLQALNAEGDGSRLFYPNVWVNILLRELQPGVKYVVPGTRKVNEAKAVLSYNYSHANSDNKATNSSKKDTNSSKQYTSNHNLATNSTTLYTNCTNLLWYVERPGCVLSEVEEELPQVKLLATDTINNNGTKDYLEEKVRAIYWRSQTGKAKIVCPS